jgi:hypothetical protein
VSLTAGERAELQDYLRDRAQRCKNTKATQLRFVAHGYELARLNLGQTASVSFALQEYAELLEIRTATDDLLLATHQLRYDDEDRLLAQDAVIVLANGQQLVFKINAAQNLITVADAAPKAQPHWRQWFSLSNWLSAPLWQPAFALALCALLAAGLAYLFFNQAPTPKREIAYTASPTPPASPTVTATPVAQATINTMPRLAETPVVKATISDDVVVRRIPARSGDESVSLTRSTRAEIVGSFAGSATSRKVFLDSGNDAFSNSLQARLLERLSADAPFALADSLEQDTVRLKVRARSVAPNRLILLAKMLDATGKVIWPLTPQDEAIEYSGPTDETLNRFSRDLMRDIRQLQQK